MVTPVTHTHCLHFWPVVSSAKCLSALKRLLLYDEPLNTETHRGRHTDKKKQHNGKHRLTSGEWAAAAAAAVIVFKENPSAAGAGAAVATEVSHTHFTLCLVIHPRDARLCASCLSLSFSLSFLSLTLCHSFFLRPPLFVNFSTLFPAKALLHLITPSPLPSSVLLP